MTEFKVGDRVRFTGSGSSILSHWRPGNTGTVTREWFSTECDAAQLGYKVRWDGATNESQHYADTLALVEPRAPKLTFVGPEPEPAKAPTVTTPFRVGEEDPSVLQDSRGLVVAEFSGQETYVAQDYELASLVRDLLNKHFEESK